MDDIIPLKIGVSPAKIKRRSRALRPAIARGSEQGTDSAGPYINFPEYWRSHRCIERRLNPRASLVNRQRKATQNSRRWLADGEDGASLAASNIWLPGDGCRQKPRLERQEAFRVPETVYISDVVENDADLYRLGLLYDDEHARGSGFDLNAIVHSEPVYAVRPAKRARHGRNTERAKGNLHESYQLALSLGDEFSFARFLSSAFASDVASASETSRSPAMSLHVIYESIEDSAHSLTPLPAVDVFPDLISDSEGEEDCNDWDLLPLLQRGDSGMTFVEDGVGDDSSDDGSGAAADAWVMLGEA